MLKWQLNVSAYLEEWCKRGSLRNRWREKVLFWGTHPPNCSGVDYCICWVDKVTQVSFIFQVWLNSFPLFSRFALVVKSLGRKVAWGWNVKFWSERAYSAQSLWVYSCVNGLLLVAVTTTTGIRSCNRFKPTCKTSRAELALSSVSAWATFRRILFKLWVDSGISR